MKSLSLPIRPIHHRKKARVEAHVLLCMLSYDVRDHWQQKLAPFLFAEKDLEPKRVDRQDRITPAKPTPQARKKATTNKEGTKTPSQKFGDLDGRAFGMESFGGATQNHHQRTKRSHHDRWPNTHPKKAFQ
ncbi:MAG: hypothetical protein OXC61_11590 [Flavobacteriaceae bacterium]|nr:hypothetical protein [Flavobacteriaceae bacterium]